VRHRYAVLSPCRSSGTHAQRPDSVAGLRGFEPSNVRLTKCLAHQRNLVALPKRFEARSAIAFCEFESSQPSHGVGRGSRVTVRSAFALLWAKPYALGQAPSISAICLRQL
jgi:hypothetical protein